MTKQIEAMKLALEALQEVYLGSRSAKHDEAITALREALAEQPAQQEPVTAAKKDAVFAASIEFIGTLTGMQPPPIEVAPPEILKPFREFTETVCLIFAAPQPAQQETVAVELVGVEEAIKEGGGFWKSCTGCYETNEGHPPTGAFFSPVFKCHMGHGCSECGGIGAIWDDTDYEAMADHMMRDDAAPQPAQQEPDELRHIGEQDCLLDVDEKAWRSLVENRGGCRCHISPPCGACSDPISEEEMNEVGYTYTSPKPALAEQPAQQEPTTKHTEPFESARVGDYNRGWNDCLFASGIVKQTEQPAPVQQEPVAVADGTFNHNCPVGTPLYTSPQAQRTWVGLTDGDIEKLREKTFSTGNPYCPVDSKSMRKAARAIEAKLKEKNT